MQTVTFYSYKGGTGRTLFLANLALLAASLGRKVVALDFDLEAPGLLYKLFRSEPRPRAEGLVGWLRDTHRGRDRPASLDDYVVDVPLNGPALHPGGTLTLLPAGRAPSPNYFQDLRHLRLEQGLEDGWVLDALVDLRDQLAQDLDADLLLIDARTGITATNRVTTHVLADEVVALALDTPEQLEGTRSVLRSLQPLTSLRTNAPIDLHLVLGRVLPRPRDAGIYALTPSEREQVARVRAFLAEPAQPITSTVEIDRVHLLHTDPALNREEFLALERPGPRTKSALHVDYWRIAIAVLGTDVEDAAVRVLEGARGDPDRLEELANYFVAPDVVAEARGAKVGVIGESRSPQGVGLEDQVELLRRQAETDPTVLPDLATQLLEVAARLQDLGRREDATRPAEEAVSIYRRLADAGAAAWEPDLARSLNNLSIDLAVAGRRDEGLAAVEEAMGIYRRLAEANPAAWEPDLARSLNNLSIRLAEAGRRVEGLTAIEEAMGIYRRLAEANPAAWRPDLARSLNNLSVDLAEVGRRDEGLVAVEQAVGIYRRLAVADAAWEPDLAVSLKNLSVELVEAGRRYEGLVAAHEAVDIHRRLAEANPAWEPDLAGSLNNLSVRLAEAGRRDEGLAAVEERWASVAGWRRPIPRPRRPTWRRRSTACPSAWRRRGAGTRGWRPSRRRWASSAGWRRPTPPPGCHPGDVAQQSVHTPGGGGAPGRGSGGRRGGGGHLPAAGGCQPCRLGARPGDVARQPRRSARRPRPPDRGREGSNGSRTDHPPPPPEPLTGSTRPSPPW